MLPEFDGSAVVQARVGAHLVVVASPLLDDHACLDARAEPLQAQALAGELVDHGQGFDLLTVGASIVDEVVGPDAVGAGRRQGAWA